MAELSIVELAGLDAHRRTALWEQAEIVVADARWELARLKAAEAIARLRALAPSATAAWVVVEESRDSTGYVVKVVRIEDAGGQAFYDVVDGTDALAAPGFQLATVESQLAAAVEQDGGVLLEFVRVGVSVLPLGQVR